MSRESQRLHVLMENLDYHPWFSEWWREIICGKGFKHKSELEQDNQEFDVIEALLGLSIENDYEKYFLLMLAPHLVEKFLGESSGI